MAKTKKKPLHPVTKYARDIISGKIIANKYVKLACQRHLDDLKRKDIFFDKDAANHIIDFFPEFLEFYEGDFDGQPFTLTPHQSFIVGSIFGWKIKETGLRRFRTAYIEEAKGNGKSPLAGGVGLYGLAFDDEAGAEIYSAATTRDQAGVLFRDARLYAEGSEPLKEILIVDKHNIAFPEDNSFFRPVSSELRGLDGKKPHMALIDEIHEHPSDLVVRKMSAGTKTRRQSLIFEITNAGYDRHSICFQHHEHTAKVLEGTIEDDSWFGMMSGLDVCEECEGAGKTIPQDGCENCDDWRDPKVWEKANPNLRYLGDPFLTYLKRQVDEAQSMPSQENIVKRLNFCIWTASITKWISVAKWNTCNFPADPERLKGCVCYGGLDLSTNIDLTAWVLVFPPLFDAATVEKKKKDGSWIADSEEKYQVLCRFFLPEDNMRERVKRDKVPYDVWARQGYIKLTPGNFIDYTFILAQIAQDVTDFQVKELAFDRWGSQKITTDLQDLGFEIEGKKNLVQFGQGYRSMSAPTKELEKMVLAREIAHGGNPVLAWNVSNVAIKIDPAEQKKPDKEKSVERIDGAVAMIMGIARALLLQGKKKSIYEGCGVKTFQ